MNRSLIVPEQHPVDAEWSRRLQSAAGILSELWAYLGPSAATLQSSFETFVASGYRKAPALQPDGDVTDRIKADVLNLQKLREDLFCSPAETWIKNAYDERITELLDNAELYRAACDGDKKQIIGSNQKLYGSPDRTIFWDCIAWLRQRAGMWSEDGGLAGREFESFEAMLGAMEDGNADGIRPSEAVFRAQRELHMGAGGFYQLLFAGLPLPAGRVTAGQGDGLAGQLLRNIGADDYRIVDSTDGYWNVRASSKQVSRPAVYDITSEEFLGVVGHEVGSHLLERINGLRQPLRLLGSGLSHYERSNEGRALVREQVVYDDWSDFESQPRWFEIICRYVAICLATGIDGHKREFCEVFSIMMHLMRAYRLGGGSITTAAAAAAVQSELEHYVWQLTARVMKGSCGRGTAYYKDMVYLDGNIACWRIAARDKEAIAIGDKGKLNLLNEDHLKLVRPS